MDASADTTMWGGRESQHCRKCRCQKHHILMADREIWIFDWCYHEVGSPESVRLLASIFFMFRVETRPSAQS